MSRTPESLLDVTGFISLDSIWKVPADQSEFMFPLLQDWPRWVLQGIWTEVFSGNPVHSTEL